MIRIAVINGPNLGNLGTREPEIYGNGTSPELEAYLREAADRLGCSISFEQHDSRGELVAAVNRASGASDGLVINPGGYSHASVAVLDAMRSFKGPVAEVHLSQIHRREPFRHRMLTAQGADVVVSGAGARGYLSAIEILLELLRR